MRARTVALGIALFAMAQMATAQEPPSRVTASELRGGVFLLEGGGGNVAAAIGDDGIVLIDAKYLRASEAMLAALRALPGGDKSLRFVVDTHHHIDHAEANSALAARGASVVAHDHARTRLARGGRTGNGGSVRLEFSPVEPGGLPLITFGEGLTLHLNGEAIAARHFPAAHTDNDAVVTFRTANIILMGDIFVRYGFPFIDIDGGGSIDGMIAACDAVLAEARADTIVIPGHGAAATRADLVEYTQMLRDTRAAVRRAMRIGRSLEAVQELQPLAAWSSRYSGSFITTEDFVETLYFSLGGPRR